MQSHVLIASLVVSSWFFCGPALAQRISTDPSEVLSKEELKAFEELKAAGGNRLSSVGATVDKEAGLVNLHFQRPLAADDTQHLLRISKLGLLFFGSGQITISDAQLRFLEGVGMKGLVVWNQPITDEGLKALKLFPQLTQLSLMGTQVTDAGLIFCRDTPLPLKKLAIEKSGITDAGLGTIGHLKSLETLTFFRCNKITDDGIVHLSSLVNLERLFLNNNDSLTSASLKHLIKMKRLTRLELDAMTLKEEDMQHLQVFDDLETLSITRTNLADGGIKLIAALKALKNLNVQNTKITDTSLALLGKCSQLSSLGLSKTEITDDGLAQLGNLKDLKSLDLSGTDVRDTGLSALKGLAKLERLSLDRTKVADASVEVISGFKGLLFLNIEGTAISVEGKKRIEAQLPECKLTQSVKSPPPVMRPRPPRVPPALPPKRDKGPDIRDRLTGYGPSGGALAMRPIGDATIERCAA